MELKRTGQVLAVALTGLLAALVVGYEAFVVIHIATTGDLGAVLGPVGLFGLFFVFFALVVTLICCASVWFVMLRVGRLRTLANRDPAVVYVAANQPDRALALRDGETLRLTYRSAQKMWRQAPLFTGLCLLLAASGEALVFAVLPVFSHSRLNPFYLELLYPPAATTPPGFLDWLVAAFPLALSAICLAFLLWSVTATGSVTVRANDQGVAIRRPFRRQMIPWNDILLFARMSPDTNASPVGTYVLWGRSHLLTFSVVKTREVDFGDKTQSNGTNYRFEGGYDAYLYDAQRLLATITARSYLPLLAMREASLLSAFRRRAPVTTTSEEDALALPLAGQEYQPQVNPESVALGHAEQLRLRARLAAAPIVGESVIWFVGLVALMALCGGLQLQQALGELSALETLWIIVIAAILVALVVFFAVQRRYNQLPAITVDAYGIGGRANGEQKPVMIPWQDITAWVVIPSPPGSNRPARYLVFGGGHKLMWAEQADGRLAGRGVQGDRRAAYSAMAARIHALIAARTGLPLRELQTDVTPAMSQ